MTQVYYLTLNLEACNPNIDTPTASLVHFVKFEVKYVTLNLQTPTSKQSKYKEQVAEMRKGRNSGLQKEQKEKHMVHRLGPLTMCRSKCCQMQTTGLPQLVTQRLIALFRLHCRSTGRRTATQESLCWKTSPVIMTWSSSGKHRLVRPKTW